MDKVARLSYIVNSLVELYKNKNSDYGDSFAKLYNKFGLRSTIIRLYDKIHRLESLLENEQKVKDESIIDTLRDIALYSLMTIIEEEIQNEKTNIAENNAINKSEIIYDLYNALDNLATSRYSTTNNTAHSKLEEQVTRALRNARKIITFKDTCKDTCVEE